MVGWPGGSTGALAHSPLPERYSSERSRETTPLHDEVWEPLPRGSLSHSQGGSLALALCQAGGVNPCGSISFLLGAARACVFIWSLGELLPVTSRRSPCPEAARGGLCGGFSFPFSTQNQQGVVFGNSCPSTGLIPAGISIALVFLPCLGWWKACASKAVFTSFLLLRTFFTILHFSHHSAKSDRPSPCCSYSQ